MSEELENSLQRSIETHFNERLRAIDEELSRLQNEFNQAFARLRESTSSGLESAPLSNAIAAHLQAAREQKLTGSASTPAPAADLSTIRRAIEEIQRQKSQADVLGALLKNAAQFTDRAALFVLKGNQAVGWRVCEASERESLEAIPSVMLPVEGNSIVARAVRSGSTETAAGVNDDDRILIDQLGGEAQQVATLPLMVRGRAVAVLYADSAWPHPDSIQTDALEMLSRVAAMAVEIISGARAPQPRPAAETAAVTEPAQPEPETEAAEAEAPAAVSTAPEEAAVEAPAYTPEVEPQAPEVADTAEPVVEAAPSPEPEPVAEPVPVAEGPPALPAASTQYAAPLGSARRYGVAEPELPIEVGEEERRLHNDARRFARLLVSEIKLYNEQKVSEGRNQGDIYERLREDIDRSREMYDKRVAPPVAARHDYFHQELVNTLAEGDQAKLGSNYPGAALAT